MKYYRATKFAIVIIPSKLSEKTKSSKLLVRSFKSIYRLGAVGIASIGSWLATLTLQDTSTNTSDLGEQFRNIPSGEGSTSYNPFYNGVGGPYSGDGGIGDGATVEEMLKLARERVTTVLNNPHAGSGTPFFSPASPTPDFFWPMIIALAVLAGGLSMEIIMRFLKVKQENSESQ